MDVFLTIYGHERSVVFREWTFFCKYGHKSSDFLVKNHKKRVSPLIECSFDRIDAFWTKYGHDSMGFYKKFEANDMRALCFWEDGRFFDKILVLEQCGF